MNQMEQLITLLQGECPDMELRRDEPMSAHTSFRIGGPVPLMAFPATAHQMACCCRCAQKADVRMEVIGRGSNLLVSDSGVDAFVVSTASLVRMARTGANEVTAGAGILLARLANFAAQENLGGLTFAHGIPGSLGGAITMNGGAYGGEMKDVVKTVRYMTPDGQVEERAREDIHFAYRHSIFCDQDWIVIEGVLELPQGERAALQEEMAVLAAKRRNSQPLEYPSGGSMFKRPQGHYAAALIDQCGLKGFSVGDAQVSEKHAGFVVNRGNATCAQVLELVEQVQQRVLEATGVALEMEVKVLR